MKLGILKGIELPWGKFSQKSKLRRGRKKEGEMGNLWSKTMIFLMYCKFPLVLWCNAKNYFCRIFEEYTYLTIDILREDWILFRTVYEGLLEKVTLKMFRYLLLELEILDSAVKKDKKLQVQNV